MLPTRVDVNGDRRPEMIRAIVAVATLSTIAVIARLASRRLKQIPLGASDYTIICAFLLCWATNIAGFLQVHLGEGRHIEIVPSANVIKIIQVGKDPRLKVFKWTLKLFQITFVCEMTYTIILVLAKISILYLYRSIFPGRDFRITTNLIGAFVLCWGISGPLITVFSCKPIDGSWDITVPSSCTNRRNLFIGFAVLNILADVFILALPMREVWRLQMAPRQKFMISGMFLLGGFVCIAMLRVYFMLSMDPKDLTWTYVGLVVWTVVELNTAIISACLPTLRPLIQYLLPRFGTSDQGTPTSDHAMRTFKAQRQKRDGFWQLSNSVSSRAAGLNMKRPEAGHISDIKGNADVKNSNAL
ncbi:hypothetical protein OEA41_007515 [Lepraria neglecta]|uniref:Rhodopsin domain-containing protein n=1 Tax=Lepraria neglecta TaxID=209136 RepID=A0AAD9ZD91_9LECA|nr:hypothetical protein OEA41_007515 [Lepraria neglecta]